MWPLEHIIAMNRDDRATKRPAPPNNRPPVTVETPSSLTLRHLITNQGAQTMTQPQRKVSITYANLERHRPNRIDGTFIFRVDPDSPPFEFTGPIDTTCTVATMNIFMRDNTAYNANQPDAVHRSDMLRMTTDFFWPNTRQAITLSLAYQDGNRQPCGIPGCACEDDDSTIIHPAASSLAFVPPTGRIYTFASRIYTLNDMFNALVALRDDMNMSIDDDALRVALSGVSA